MGNPKTSIETRTLMKLDLKHIILILLLCLFSPVGNGQNPFDISYKTKPSAEQLEILQDSLAQNPFNKLERDQVRQVNELVLSRRAQAGLLSKKLGFWYFLISVFLIAVIRTFDKSLFNTIFEMIQSGTKLSAILRRRVNPLNANYLMLFVLFVIQLGYFIFLGFERFDLIGLARPGTMLLAITGGVAAYYLGKYLLLIMMKSIYPVDEEVSYYTNHMLIFGIAIGILLVVFNALITFGSTGFSKVVLGIAILLLCIVLIYRHLRVTGGLSRSLLGNGIYFLLYLCAVEISPLLLLYTWMQ